MKNISDMKNVSDVIKVSDITNRGYITSEDDLTNKGEAKETTRQSLSFGTGTVRKTTGDNR